MTARVGVLTISDSCSRGTRDDKSGDAIATWIAEQGHTMNWRATVPDDVLEITGALIRAAEASECDVILTTGGTGIAPRDVTPESMRVVIERPAPGIAEAIRAAGLRSTPRAALSRGMAGVHKSTLIVNLPGSTSGVIDGLAVMQPLMDHIADLLHGDTEH